MATFYCQAAAGVNIDAVSGGTTSNVWNDAANGSGNWMDISVLTAGGSATILCANGKAFNIAVNIDINIGTGRLSTAAEGGTAGGNGFVVTGTRSIIGNIVAGTSICLAPSGTGYTLTVTGNVTGGSVGTNAWGINIASAMTTNVTGIITGGGSINRYGIRATSGTLTVTGNVVAGSATNTPGVNSDVLWTLVDGNIINNTSSQAIVGPHYYNPGAANYIQCPKTTGGAGTYNYGKTIPAASVIEAVDGDGANAPATGTYHEATVAEVQDGVMFGPASAYEGEYVGGGGSKVTWPPAYPR